eukprot:COSAG01_NODE_2146_length_8303_cov_24.698684_10_plen_95_part_00
MIWQRPQANCSVFTCTSSAVASSAANCSLAMVPASTRLHSRAVACAAAVCSSTSCACSCFCGQKTGVNDTPRIEIDYRLYDIASTARHSHPFPT